MLIDCTTCVARDHACGDCVVTVLLSAPPLPAARPQVAARPQPATHQQHEPHPVVELDEAERQAIETLVGAGLVPPLRLVSGA